MKKPLRIAAVAAALAGGASAETWYWHPTHQETRTNVRYNQSSFGPFYWWIDENNWTNAVGQTGFPKLGDTVVVEDTAQTPYGVCGPLQEDSVYPDACATNAIESLTIVNNNSVSQGNIALQAGGGGLTYLGTVNGYTALGLVLVGDGEVPVDIRNDVNYLLQMRMVVSPANAKAVLVKKGAGRLVSFYQHNNCPYTIPVNRIQQGTLTPNTYSQVANGIEFWFDGNDESQRLELGYVGAKLYTNNLPIANGLLGEMNGVDNTAHGVTADYDNYLHFTGTPKANPMTFTGSFYKMAGLRWAPSDGAVFEISKSTSTTRGRLLVDAGTVRLADGASFTSLSKVEVADGATLEIGEGCSVRCSAATLRGTDLAIGTYAAAATPGLSGAGTLVVSSRAEMSPDQLVLDVPSGTKTLAEALADYNTANGTDYAVADLNGGSLKAYDLIKTGAGTLAMDQKIDSYTGDISIEGGIISCTNRYALGAESGVTYVRTNATLYCAPPAKSLGINANRTVHIVGTGADGKGALRSIDAFFNYGEPNIFCANLILDGDAAVTAGRWHFIANAVTLNGHTLTNRYPGGDGDRARFLPTVNDAGKIVMDGTSWRTAGLTLADATPGNEVVFKNGGGFRFWYSEIKGAGRDTWLFTFAAGSTTLHGDDNNNVTHENNNNVLWNPIHLDGTVSQTSQGNTWRSRIKMRGVLSGGGQYNVDHVNEPDELHLFNPANTFSGKVYVNRGIVYVYEPGTLPAAATLDINSTRTLVPGSKDAQPYPPPYHGAAFMSPGRQTLGSLLLRGSQPARVQGGIGAFATVTKSDANTAEYYTGLGAKVLDVAAGTVKLPRGPAPGLWEGTNMYANATAVQSAFATSVVHTNLVMRGPHSANALYGVNYTTAGDKKLITYTGYVWNRTGADATWTFASSVNGPVKVLIDGEEVIATTAGALQKAQKTLSPGPHTFEYRAYNNSPRATGWAAKCGFMYDAQGRNESTTNNYAWCVDPGDGSLFTRSLDAADLPLFEEMKFAQGATLDVNGNAYTAAAVSGWPTVLSSATDASAAPSLVITNKFIVNGDTVAANRKMTVDMPLSFGETGGVLATNLEGLAHGVYTIASTTAASGIASSGAPLNTRLKTDSKRWLVRVSEDGKSLELFYAPGTILSFR